MRQTRDQLTESIASAARSTWRELCADRPDVAFAGFALHSDEAASSLICSALTADHLADATAEDAAEIDEDGDGAEFADALRWTPSEWDADDIGSWFFDAVNEILLEGVREEEPLDDRAVLFDAAVDALERLRSEGEFERHPEVVVLFRLSDDEHDERDREWLARLNPVDIVEEYDAWLDA